MARTKTFSKGLLAVPILIYLLIIVSGISFVEVTAPVTVGDDTLTLEYNISTDNLVNVTWNWNGTNHKIFGSTTRLLYNFNNESGIGEDDSKAVDVVSGQNLTVTGATVISDGFSFDGNGDSLVGSTNFALHSTNNDWTFKTKFIINECGNEEGVVGFGNSTAHLRVYCNINDLFIFYYNQSGSGKYRYFDAVSTGSVYDMVFTYNGSAIYVYQDGSLTDTITTTGSNTLPNITDPTVYVGVKPTNNGYLNGTVYELEVWEEAFNSTTVNHIYRTELEKYDSTTWGFNSVEDTSDPSGTQYTYYLCSSNSTAQACTDEKTLTKVPQVVTVHTNYTQLVGTINPYFYGTNDQYNQLAEVNGEYLDVDCDGTNDEGTNHTWHRELFEPTRMNHVRIWNYDLNNIALSEGVYNETKIQYLLNEAEYLNSIGAEVTFVAYGTPTWLANTTTGWCGVSNPYYAGQNASCSPTNVTKLAIIHNYIIGNLTQVIPESRINFITYNEPWHQTFFLDQLNQDNVTKAIEFGKIHNASYHYIKNNYPDVEVGWSMYTSLQSDVLSNHMMANYTDDTDFIGLHYYDSTSYFKNLGWNIDDTVNDLLSDCETYGVNCSKIIFDEWDINDRVLANDNNYSMEIAYFYQYLLNTIPDSSQSMKFKWSARHAYGCNVAETEWSGNEYFPMVNEVNDSVDVDYNVTKNFATRHVSNSEVYNSSSSTSDLQVISTKNGSTYYVTIMNTGSKSKNVSLEIGSIGINTLNASTSDSSLSVSGSTVNVGVIESYEILYLEGYTLTVEASSSEQLGCSFSARTGFNLVMIFLAFGIVGYTIMFVYRVREGNVSMGDFIVLFLIITVGIVVYQYSGQSLGNACGVVG